jgi:hypothetical protein
VLDTGELYTMNLQRDDETTPPAGLQGDFWLNRATGELYEWEDTAHAWVLSSDTIESRWIRVFPETIRNSLVLLIENKLFASVHPYQQLNVDLKAQTFPESYQTLELARFAAKYGYDTYAPDYDEDDAFTWNYSEESFPGVPAGTARWNSIYESYFESITGFKTPRPDLTPWQLGTASFPASAEKPAGWDAAYASTASQAGPYVTAKVISMSELPVRAGLLTIDSVALEAGDVVLVSGQSNSVENGIFVVNAGPWTLAGVDVSAGVTVGIAEGATFAGTYWVMSNFITQQLRVWKREMWDEIVQAHPGIRLCVNVNTDELLPPYVNPTRPSSAQALTTVPPSNPDAAYEFGQGGPVESVWYTSIEYLYGLARTAFRVSPLDFLDKTWGETYTSTDGCVRAERNLQSSLPVSKFLLHGEQLNLINYRSDPKAHFNKIDAGLTWVQAFGGTITFKVSHVASSGQVSPAGSFGPSATVFSVLVNDHLAGYVVEGEPFSFTAEGVTFTDVTIDDLGIPFELGDTLMVTIEKDTVTTSIPTTGTDFVYGLLGCVGCVADATPDPTMIVDVVRHDATFSFSASKVKVFKGLGQLFTNLLRHNYLDTTSSEAVVAYRGWDIKLVHRVGALLRPDTVSIKGTTGLIPSTAYTTLIKKTRGLTSAWISGLRVSLLTIGTNKLNGAGRFVPVGTADDWVFQVETYNSSHPYIDVNVVDTTGPYTTFDALDKKNTEETWYHYESSGNTARVTTPITVTGLQNVVNLIYSYTSQLEEEHFSSGALGTALIDAETGRVINWQLEIEKMIDTMYQGIDAGTAVILNPFMDKLTLETPIGLMGRYSSSKFLDAYSSQAAYDATGTVIPVKNLSVIRTDERTVTYSKTPIFSAHVFTDEYEHALLLNERFSSDTSSPVIFDQFLGQSAATMYLSYYRNAVQLGKPTFDGFFILGNDVKRNVNSTVDALSRAYDADQTFLEPTMAKHALALLGFSEKDYLSNIDISPKVQLDFWRGMISAKGTNAAITAFTQYKAFKKASVDEFWAYKLATYGDARERSLPEIKIEPSDCARQFTSLQFYSATDPSYTALPLFTQVEASDDSRWFSIDDLGTLLRFDATEVSELVDATTAGYVDLEHVYHNGDNFAPTIAYIDPISGEPGTANGAVMVNARTVKLAVPGQYLIKGYTWGTRTALSPVKLYDYSSSTLISNVELWHPAIGIHACMVLELVDITNNVDPAHYNYSSQTSANPNYAVLKPWDEQEVGRVWWDTTRLDYVPYYDALIFPNRETRSSRWGSLADWGSVDLYQWTESPVHPSEYDALAQVQEGDSSLDSRTRLSGRVGFTRYYSANRVLTVKPIAWSRTGRETGAGHPAFGLAADVLVYTSDDDQLVVDRGRLADVGLTDGRHFGGWDLLAQKPIGEVEIGDTVKYVIGSRFDVTSPEITIPSISSGTISSITVTELPNSSFLGVQIGQLFLTSWSSTIQGVAEWTVRCANAAGDVVNDVTISDWSSSALTTEASTFIDFERFGIRLTITATSPTGLIPASDLASAITQPSNDIYVREGVNFNTIIPLTAVAFSNESVYGIVSNVELGWKAWDVPSAADLSSDLAAPRNRWRPYLGDEIEVELTSDVIDVIKAGNSWTLSSGVMVERYSSTWTDWTELKDVIVEMISDGVQTPILSMTDDINATRLSVYVNGIQVSPAQVSVDANLAELAIIPAEGSRVRFLYRAYSPTPEELEFDPEVEDDLTVFTRYKKDYEYTKIDYRDTSGNVSGSRYYFWVKGKSDVLDGKSLSLQQAVDTLESGNSVFMLFSRAVESASSKSGVAFDSCSISGLGRFVTKSDSFKLRFIRDFTLRLDPDELKLKNVHTEWALIRPGQSTKIPTQLWSAITDAACGQDLAGNALPAPSRVAYDARHGTATRYGFESGQIFAESELVLATVIQTVLNTSLTIEVADETIVDYITFLGIDASTNAEDFTATWFSNPTQIRKTMNLIYSSARALQVNEIFFAVLYDALANNYEFTDLFKTSYITVNSTTVISEQTQQEQTDEFY